jgi:hypothetical protein
MLEGGTTLSAADIFDSITIAVDTVIGVKRQSGLRDDFWLFQSLA